MVWRSCAQPRTSGRHYRSGRHFCHRRFLVASLSCRPHHPLHPPRHTHLPHRPTARASAGHYHIEVISRKASEGIGHARQPPFTIGLRAKCNKNPKQEATVATGLPVFFAFSNSIVRAFAVAVFQYFLFGNRDCGLILFAKSHAGFHILQSILHILHIGFDFQWFQNRLTIFIVSTAKHQRIDVAFARLPTYRQRAHTSGGIRPPCPKASCRSV